MQKAARKNTKYSRNETILKMGHFAKVKNGPFCKSQKLKFQKKHAEIDSTNTLKYSFVQKNCSKKQQIFQKWDHFENRPFCKGYSLGKIVGFGQKIKFQKTCRNRFYKHIKVVLCKKPLQKTPNIPEMRPFLKTAILQSL